MSTYQNLAFELAQTAKNKLIAKLTDREAPIDQLNSYLEEYRSAAEKAIFSDFQLASEKGTEGQLWNTHGKINTRFRRLLNNLRREGKNRNVEIRVLLKQYLNFIKASQRFYRQYILQLDACFDGIPELRQVAHKWKDSTSSRFLQKSVSEVVRRLVLLSCHTTLIQLGDLSRYRETEWPGKERNWGPAIGYYSLAYEIYPTSGKSHNQQAVIAQADGNHFRAMYHLYRSLASEVPCPMAKGNMEIESKKVLSAWDKGELTKDRSQQNSNSTSHVLVAWFVCLHSKCYKGEKNFPGHDELESEVLSQLVTQLKERSLDGTLQKIILINLAAEYFAAGQIKQESESQNFSVDTIFERDAFVAYKYFLRLNAKTFFTLLEMLSHELKSLVDDRSPHLESSDSNKARDNITVVMRRILPGLRVYSPWFLNTWKILDSKAVEAISISEVQELWRSYANTMTLIAQLFPVQEFSNKHYLLEEDTATIGFQPLMSEKTSDLWYEDGKLRPKWSDEGVRREHPNVEMLMRIRDFLVHGLTLTQDTDAPIELDAMQFIYRDVELSPEAPSSPTSTSGEISNDDDDSSTHFAFPISCPTLRDVDDCYSTRRNIDDIYDWCPYAAQSEPNSISFSRDLALSRMVDDLVGPDDPLEPGQEEDENIPPTPPEQTFEDTTLVDDSYYGILPLTEEAEMVRNRALHYNVCQCPFTDAGKSCHLWLCSRDVE